MQSLPRRFLRLFPEGKKKIWVLFSFLACMQLGHSQALNFKRFSQDEGLPDRYIYTIIQDDNDFLWVGTGNGIFRFDGEEFKLFNDQDTLAEQLTTSSAKDDQGRIWFGHFAGGISLMDKGAFRQLLPQDTLSSSIVGIQQAPDGGVWVASQAEGLVRFDQDLNYELFSEGLDEDTRVFSFTCWGEQNLLLGTDAGIRVLSYQGGKLRLERTVSGLPPTKIQSIVPSPSEEGTFWVGTEDEGLFEFHPGESDGSDQIRSLYGEQLYGIENVGAILEDQESRLWLGTQGRGLLPFQQRETANWLTPVRPLLENDTLGNDVVRSVFQDRFGQIWIGTYGNGLVCLTEKTFTQFRLEDDTLGTAASNVFQDQDRNLWISTPSGLHLVEWEEAIGQEDVYTLSGVIPMPSKRRFTGKDGLPEGKITAINQDPRGVIWVGTQYDGVFYLDSSQSKFVPIEYSNQTLGLKVTDVEPISDSELWIGTVGGVFRYNPLLDEVAYLGTRNGIPHNNIYDLFGDQRKIINIITHTNRIARFIDGEIVEEIIADSLVVPNINYATQDEAGNMWYATDGMGLYTTKQDSILAVTTEQGLFSNYCYQVELDRFSTVWATHRNGFTRYIPSTGTTLPYPNRDHFDFTTNEIFGTQLDSKGNIWFATSRGVIRYNWEPTRTQMPAPYIQLEGFEVLGDQEDLAGQTDLPYGDYRIRFAFLGLTFLDQSEVVYQYKLEGRDKEWSDITSKTAVVEQGLVDGDYTFVVRARNKFGIWNEEPASFSFSIAPPWWKTWWFRALVGLVAVSLIFLYVKYRTYRLNKEKEALEGKVKERTLELSQEKKKLEIANLELEKLSLVASETDNAVFIIDKNGKLEWVNPGFSRLTGYSFDEITAMQSGKSFLDLSSNSEISRLVDEVVRNNSSAQYESRLPSKSGEPIWVISTLTPILDANGALRKIVIIDSNITERKEAEEKVRRINERLEQLVEERTQELAETNQKLIQENSEHVKTAKKLKKINRELDTFVYRASHDLKGPLASLLGLMGIARSELEENESVVRYLDLMQRRGQRLDTILVDLIEATQVKQSPLTYERINLKEEAEAVVGMVRQKYQNAETNFELEIDEGLTAITDRTMLRAVLQNYIENSHRYRDTSKPNCISKTRIELQNGDISIAVTDNGTGMPPRAKEKMFEMFFRGTNTVSGSGLGLYIVRQAVEKLRGKVDMSSEYGEGSTFRAYLPNLPESFLGKVENPEY